MQVPQIADRLVAVHIGKSEVEQYDTDSGAFGTAEDSDGGARVCGADYMIPLGLQDQRKHLRGIGMIFDHEDRFGIRLAHVTFAPAEPAGKCFSAVPDRCR